MEHSITEQQHKGNSAKKMLIVGLALIAIAAGAVYFADDNDGDTGENGAGFPQCPPKCAINHN